MIININIEVSDSKVCRIWSGELCDYIKCNYLDYNYKNGVYCHLFRQRLQSYWNNIYKCSQCYYAAEVKEKESLSE